MVFVWLPLVPLLLVSVSVEEVLESDLSWLCLSSLGLVLLAPLFAVSELPLLLFSLLLPFGLVLSSAFVESSVLLESVESAVLLSVVSAVSALSSAFCWVSADLSCSRESGSV